VVDVDAVGVDSECGEAVPLGGEVLVGRADPGVALAVLLAERSPIIPVLRSDIETLYVWSTSTPYEETPDGRWQFSVPLGDDVLNEARRLLASYE